jgi:ferredoxin
MEDVYRSLAAHLDNLPAGFPPTESGVELRILKRLFTPAEAQIAPALTMMPEAAEAIAKRLDMAVDELEPILREMAHKGLIVHSTRGGHTSYGAAQFMIGIWEYHVKSLDEGLIKDFNEYAPHLMKASLANNTKQLRVIPISKEITADARIMAYEDAEKIIRSQSKIAVAPCICRTEHAMVGKDCGKPKENCLVFAGGAYYYEETQLGRSISQEEALAILREAVAAGLVLQPGNSQKPMNICMCCGCCCQVLKNIKAQPKPGEAVNSSYFAVVDAENCTACGVCEERCPMDAITIDDVAVVARERCIGCGVCAGGCDFEAIRLVPKDEDQRWVPPSNTVETYINIAKERGML